MHELQSFPSALWVVQRRSEKFGVMHVALVDSVTSWNCPNGDPALSNIFEFSARDGLTVRPVDLDAGWTVVKRVDDQSGARARLASVLASGAPYDLLFNNCEHMVSYVTEGARRSPQIRNAVFAMVGVASLVAWIGSSSRKVA